MHVVDEELDEELLALVLRVLGDDGAVEVRHERLHLARLPHLPQVARHVEHQSLEEQDEADPLVVLVVLNHVAFSHWADARGRHVFAHHCGFQPVYDGVRRLHPAVRVHDLGRHFLD